MASSVTTLPLTSTRPYLHQLEHLRDGHQLVALGFHRRLRQAQALLGGPDAHELDRGLALAGGRGAAQLLAVDNQVPTGQQGHDGLPPLAQAMFQFGRFEAAKDPVKRVVGGDAGRQVHKLAQRRLFVTGVIVDILKGLAISQ